MTTSATNRLEELSRHVDALDAYLEATETTPDPVMVANGARIVFANAAMQRMVGADITGHEWRPYVYSYDDAASSRAIYRGRIGTRCVTWYALRPTRRRRVLFFGRLDE